MSSTLTVLIVGGYGTFGGRIVELLENEPRLTLIVAGRALERAVSYCKNRPHAKARLVAATFNRMGDVFGQLAEIRPDLVVDASGPFQDYGSGRYRLVEACISNRINYFDLADSSDFVNGVHAFDSASRAAGIYILSGVSSFPVLTAAVVRRLTSDMDRVDTIRGGIAPSPYAGVGHNVIRAIASYAGKPAALRRHGKESTGYPFTEHMRFTIAPPGYVPLRSTLFSLVDVPDLRALAQLWPEVRNIWMGAGPVPEILHRALSALAWLVRSGFVRSLLPLSPLMHFASNRLRWGEHRGGMFVEVRGEAPSGAVARSWHLIAEGDDGPLIPSMAIQALIYRVLKGSPPHTGARAAVCDLELSDYDQLFEQRTIYTGIRELSHGLPLYPRLLGQAWPSLPQEIREMHDGTRSAKGRAIVERGHSLLGRLVAAAVGFPRSGTDVAVDVSFDIASDAETWTRKFGEESFSSIQSAGVGRSEGLLCEQFGPLRFAMALVPRGTRLELVLRRWALYGLPLPMWFCPRSNSYESVEGGRFRFHVEISHPFVGLIVRYRGWLTPQR